MRKFFSILHVYFSPHLQIARHALGKYIIGFASILHIVWAVLVLIDIRAGNATPIALFFVLLGGSRFLVVSLLLIVAFLAIGFLDLRLRAQFNLSILSLLLIPQQCVLLCSAGAGIHAACIQQYADGMVRSWSHILADQLPIILIALLYTIALLETRHPYIIESLTKPE